MSIRVPVALGARSYEVVVGSGILESAATLFPSFLKKGKIGLVTDSNVGPLYAESLTSTLESAGYSVTPVTVPAGESSKSIVQTEKICDALIAAGLDRNSFLIALGGGVVGDLAGFVASIYFRGIPYVQIPTTIVAQVDSAVGGKTGVNATAGKNLIGAFHQPSLVLADTDTLATLPAREFNEGMAEVIKHAIIRDPAMFEQLATFDRNKKSALSELIARNVEIKAKIVSEDEQETKGLRALLNFGHTIGHGIENAAGYGRFLHGEAISLGILAAARLSVRLAGLPDAQCAAIQSLLNQFDLPLQLPPDITTAAIFSAMGKDKKFEQGLIRFVLSPHIGEAFVSKDVSSADIEAEIESLRIAR